MRKLCAIAINCSLILTPIAGARAETRIQPYIEAQQILDAELGNNGDVLTYSALAAGVDATATGKRVEAQISYRYERRIPWDDGIVADNVHSGLARVRAEAISDMLWLDTGAIATRTRSDIRGDAPVFLTGDNDNITQVYGIYAGPNFAHRFGHIDVAANYRFGYVKVKDNNSIALPSGQPVLDRYNDATSHDVSMSVGMPSGDLPFAWTVTGGYTRESASQLSQRYIGKHIRDDVVWPISPTLAVTGGIGYEDIKITERNVLRDVNGLPVLNGSGRFITDPSSPRLLAYATDGFVWDVGAIWKPNRRTTIEVRGGERYGSRAITGTLDYRVGRRTALRIGVYDAIDSFGRSLTENLASLPTSFNINRNALSGDFGGCIFGSAPGTGGCLDDTLQSITTSNYRSRGFFAMLSGERGPWTFGLGAGYANHKFLAPRSAGLFSIDGVKDQSASAEASLVRRLSSVSGVNTNVFANWYKSGISAAPAVRNVGATTSYYRNITDHLVGQVSVGAYNSHVNHTRNNTHAQAVVSLRYQF